ncbi:hypothetical protein BDW62DRAFT_198001 [Aspergillus aurantiobrunneus]
MTSNNHEDDKEPGSSGYEGDISDQVSEVCTITVSGPPPCCDFTDDESISESHESKIGTIWIGCDVRDVGPGVENDEEAEFGTIWIGCSLRDMGFDSYQAFLDSDDQAEVEHIENVAVFGDGKHSKTGTDDARNKESRACKQQSK